MFAATRLVCRVGNAGDADEVALGVGEVSNDQVRARVLLGAHPACPTQTFGLLQRHLDVVDADVEDCVALVSAPAADAARDPDAVASGVSVGPQRFSDLRHALPNASSNLVADRLRELEGRGVIHRRKLLAPASSWVYELTEWGRDLESILLALGDWGIYVPRPPAPATLSATSVLLFLRSSAHLDPETPPTSYRLELDDRVWTLRTEDRARSW